MIEEVTNSSLGKLASVLYMGSLDFQLPPYVDRFLLGLFGGLEPGVVVRVYPVREGQAKTPKGVPDKLVVVF